MLKSALPVSALAILMIGCEPAEAPAAPALEPEAATPEPRAGGVPESIPAFLRDHAGEGEGTWRAAAVDLNGDGVREMIVATTGGSFETDPRDAGRDASETSPPEIRLVEITGSWSSDSSVKRRRRRRRRPSGAATRSAADIVAGENHGAGSFFGSPDAFEPARTIAKASLARGAPNPDAPFRGSPARAVAIGAGGVLPFRNASATAAAAGAKPVRKGVVVVVTEGWRVVCFDHNLRVLWERALDNPFAAPDGARGLASGEVVEAAVLVTTRALYEGDRGSVIVGGRVAPSSGNVLWDGGGDSRRDPLAREMEHERAVRAKRGGHRLRRGSGSGSETASRSSPVNPAGSETAIASSRHFNYYAFETASGELRWKHETEDFHRDLRTLEKDIVPQHHPTLDASAMAAAEGRHFGEASCREFRESVVAALAASPHRWTHREDTTFALARFEHHKTAQRREAARSAFTEGDGEENVAERFPRNRDVRAPNAVVARREEGVEVIHLFSGRTLCKMFLLPHETHADINGDGVLEHARARGGGRFSLGEDSSGRGWNSRYVDVPDESGLDSRRNCFGRVVSGTPPRELVFEGSICRGSLGVTRAGDARVTENDRMDSDDARRGGFVSGPAVDAAAPIFLRRGEDFDARNRGKGKTIRDVLFFNSRGDVTSYTAKGTKRWQLRTDSGWMRGSEDVASVSAFSLRSFGNSGTAAREDDFSSRIASEVALCVGATRATFITASGYKLSVLKLPARPIGSVLIEDVNGDGLNDAVLRTEAGTFCWVQKSSVGTKPFSVLAGALALMVGGTFVFQLAHAHSVGTTSIVRSTEMEDSVEGRKDR
jgi:hypothetical protein